MKWTNSKPNKEGFYWLRHYVDYSITDMDVLVTEIVKVEKLNNELWVLFCGTEIDEEIESFDDNCFWFGPLIMPNLRKSSVSGGND